MACSMTEEKGMSNVEFSKCPICFDQFKTPRVLPCSHTLCHDCVSSHISSTCQSKDDPSGFLCPICQEFVPAPSFILNFEDWSRLLPTCNLLEDVSCKTESMKLCEVCERENEKEKAVNYCLSCCEALCDNCTTYHRKNRVSCDHKICRFDEMENLPELSKISTNILCTKHKDRSIELFCNDHEEPCCAMCCSTEHRKCESVETIEQKAEKVRSSGSVRVLINNIEKFGRELSEAKCMEEKNITEIEKEAGVIIDRVRSLKIKAIQNLERLEIEFLNKVSTKTKECKGELKKNIQTIGDIIQSMEFCRKNAESATNFQDVNFLTEFLKTKKTLETIVSKKVERLEFELQSHLAPDFIAVANLSEIGKLKLLETKESLILTFDVKNIDLELCKEIQLSWSRVRSGVFLSNTDVIFPLHKTNTAKRYFTVKDKWTPKGNIRFRNKLFDIQQNGDFLFASCSESKTIDVLSAKDFQLIRSIDVDHFCYGISFRENLLFAACNTSIIKMDTDGNKLRSYPTSSGVYYVAVTKNLDIVFSNEERHKVVSLPDKGDSLWTYSHHSLKHPSGLHIDCDDIIYVAGKDSNNIHVLYVDGSVLHIIENMYRPLFFMLSNDRSICCCIGIHHIWPWDTSIKMYTIK
ncbi:E3 ubiquitin-protein ligase TRIM33-like [Saccostrea echinata]|uniref:E3 ubiquitin-protein ligase TRIM33-like n=1 Tax=Saccostrea echinata TaxID=191078 RepID=UPI002A7EB24B|nr:E3 ubiquitin-protein ligase TRIM33-like [Saccostrea echinata]